jgi:hypothetical protein
MAVSSPRRQTLRRFTWAAAIASLVAGGAVYLQVSGGVAAAAQVAAAFQPGDGDEGGFEQAPQPAQPQFANPGPGSNRPIAVTGGS